MRGFFLCTDLVHFLRKELWRIMGFMSKYTITPSLFFQYAACPHWIWFDHFGDKRKKGEVPELAQKLLDQGVVHEEAYIKNLHLTKVKTLQSAQAFGETLRLMQEGSELIYQGAIESLIGGNLWRGRPDLLEKRKGTSIFGDYFYAPVDIKSSHSLKREHQLQLTMYALILREIQGVLPTETAIINIDQLRIDFQIEKKHIQKTKERVRDIIKILDGEKPPLRLGSGCKQSPWFRQCVAQAKEANDIALVYNLDARATEVLRKKGLGTVDALAKANLKKLSKIPFASPSRLLRAKLQAESLITEELKWITKPVIADAPLKIYFDIEGDPLLDVLYLFGFWMVGDPERKYAKFGSVHSDNGDGPYFLAFLAETPEEEVDMWKQFLKWVEILPKDEYVVYHYADYERAKTLAMAQFHGGSQSFDHFASKYVDLLKIVLECVIFPLHFYSIKDIARSKFLNYRWRHKKAGGAQSIFWYEKWLETGDRSILQDILEYNEDDVIATQHLHEWLVRSHPYD